MENIDSDTLVFPHVDYEQKKKKEEKKNLECGEDSGLTDGRKRWCWV